MNSLLSDTPMIGFFQEPYTVQNKVVFRPQGYKVIPEATCTAVPRAALFIPNIIQSISLGHLNKPDCAVAQIKWNSLDILIASIYLDKDDDVVQPWLSDIVEYADNRNMAVLLCLDSNAHSSFYSDAVSDERGGDLEDFIMTYNLDIANKGHIPTFQTFCASSVIDVSLIKGISLYDWHVDTSYNASDHNTIVFQIDALEVPEKEIRPWKSADWPTISSNLDAPYSPPERMTLKKLDREVGKMYHDLNMALDVACPTITWKPGIKNSLWYTDALRLLHFKVQKQFRKANSSGVQDEFDKYTTLHNRYCRRCRRAKNKSWRTFVSETPNEHKMAFLSKLARHRDRLDLNVLYKQDGSISEPGTDTIRRLVEVHFPQAEIHDQFPPRDNSRAALSSDISGKYDYISRRLVKLSLLRFFLGKSPGPDGIQPIVFRYLPPSFLDRLAFIYECCIHFHYTPRAWQFSRVVFISKPGKPDYHVCKNHRPIVVSNFFLKGLERLITWKMDDNLKYYPIHQNQHGFQIGKGT